MRERIVAVIPCKNGEGTVGATVEALLSEPAITSVVVVDDGSHDATTQEAASAGAQVVFLEHNLGKGGAVAAGIAAAPTADVYLLVDADTGESATGALHLLPPVVGGEADLTIGVLPSAGRKGGFGVVKRLAQWGIERACGFRARAPLSGQRAITADLARSLELAPRFGLEVAMTIDAVRRGARVVELDVDMDHMHRGRQVGGFLHRGRQGWDAAKVLWPRVVPHAARLAMIAVATAGFLGYCLWAANTNTQPEGRALPKAKSVEIVLVPGGTWIEEDDRAYSSLEHQTTGVPSDATIKGSIVTGDVEDVIDAVRAGSRDADAEPSPDVTVRVLPLGRAPQSLAPGSVRITAGITTGDAEPELRPVAISGLPANGKLVSSSTRRSGLVDLTDLGPTALAIQGLEIPASMSGSPLRFEPVVPDTGAFAKTNSGAHFYEDLRPGVIWVYGLFQLAVFLWAFAAAGAGKEVPFAGYLASAIAAFPLATYVVRWFTGIEDLGTATWSALIVLAVGMIAVMSGIGRAVREPTLALRRVLAATIVFISADVLLGSSLQMSGIFGSSPLLGTRYHGLGNPASVLLLVATVLWSALYIQSARRPSDAWWRALAVWIGVTAVVGVPGLGSDVGGLFAMIVTGAGLFAALKVGKFTGRMVAGVLGVAVTLVSVVAVADYLRPADARTHLGRMVDRLIDEGFAPLVDIVSRKVDANILGYGFPWTLGAVALGSWILYALIRGRWSMALPIGSTARIGAIAALAGSFVSYAVNDSGIVVLGLVAVFLGPYLMVEYRLTRSATLKLEVSA